MNDIREKYISLTNGDYKAINYDLDSIYIYERNYLKEKVIVIFNLSEKNKELNFNLFKYKNIIYSHNYKDNIISRYGVVIINGSNN